MEKKGLLVTNIRDEELLGGGPGMLRISSKAVSQASPDLVQDGQSGDEQEPHESLRRRQSMLNKTASAVARRSSAGLGNSDHLHIETVPA
ncbi:hypothetical protein DUNSADRAFT_6669 [Dunaliella salina]|uniref:Encoded protein n=1 Tax=Dunaliella salina TaxID=3046 RepID=A0ABQ7GMW1_DUNSA|nr:hypothetical protein DUNSADRAFT_6669 [Dunaliella salina]|eukprot:KAF5835912.1 hypothetical protein DUNSADRAFT_6669 [Dunaliella salina]